MLRKVLFFIAVFSSQIWLGTAVFVSFVLAPLLFKTFGVELAANVLSAVFPVYGIVLLLCSGLALSGYLVNWQLGAFLGRRLYGIGALAMLLAWLLNLLQTLYIFPHVKALRTMVHESRLANVPEKITLHLNDLMVWHRISVWVNGVVLLLSLVVAVYFFLMIQNRRLNLEFQKV